MATAGDVSEENSTAAQCRPRTATARSAWRNSRQCAIAVDTDRPSHGSPNQLGIRQLTVAQWVALALILSPGNTEDDQARKFEFAAGPISP